MSAPARYRKQPVVIQATQLSEEADWEDVAAWCGGSLRNICDTPGGEPETVLTISTFEGDMRGTLGDWIIRGVKGEFYPCRSDIFEATYEPAEETP